MSQKTTHGMHIWRSLQHSNGLQNDLRRTRIALQAIAGNDNVTAFGVLYQYTQGHIANLNQVLRNLKREQEIGFSPECFFAGIHDNFKIELWESFWKQVYTINQTNVFRARKAPIYIDQAGRNGRSYEAENAKTRHSVTCHACFQNVSANDRITI